MGFPTDIFPVLFTIPRAGTHPHHRLLMRSNYSHYQLIKTVRQWAGLRTGWSSLTTRRTRSCGLVRCTLATTSGTCGATIFLASSWNESERRSLTRVLWWVHQALPEHGGEVGSQGDDQQGLHFPELAPQNRLPAGPQAGPPPLGAPSAPPPALSVRGVIITFISIMQHSDTPCA